MADRPGAPRGYIYAILALATVAVALVGYLGYVFYPRPPGGHRGDPPRAGGGRGNRLVLLSVLVPASPLDPRPTDRRRGGVATGTAVSQGGGVRRRTLGRRVAVLRDGGLAIAAGASTYFDDVTFTSAAGITIRIVVGLVLVTLGLIQLNVRPISFRRFEPALRGYLRRQAEVRRRRPVLGFTLFGLG